MADIDAIIAGLDAAVSAGLDDAANAAAGVAYDKAPQGETRRLQKSVYMVKRGKYGREIGARAPYAGFVEGGRGPIEAKGKALHFFINGKEVFARRVGPAKAQPFIAPARAELERTGAGHVQAAVDRLIGT